MRGPEVGASHLEAAFFGGGRCTFCTQDDATRVKSTRNWLYIMCVTLYGHTDAGPDLDSARVYTAVIAQEGRSLEKHEEANILQEEERGEVEGRVKRRVLLLPTCNEGQSVQDRLQRLF
ncbi:hypothetical protein HPB50_026990 [Hyalomma asiaticum]|uniref:Uncharacterized protein n=1 Tax=Hyalomma asiaticum TaxID=266040 RepID=A0ACB7SAU8_HYAAI|nr:hypothetical protein HPB50_026990 [Hyalomma asiaticum]